MTPIEQLQNDLATSKLLLSRQAALIDALRLESKQLRSENTRLKRQAFGRKSERLQEEDPNQLHLFEEKEGTSRASKHGDDSSKKEGCKSRKRGGNRKGGKGRSKLPAHLRRIEVCSSESGPTECECCGGKLKPIGFDTSERLEHLPEKYVVLVVKQAKYACPNCPTQGVITQPAPPFSLARYKYADGFVTKVLVDKYGENIPLRRQCARFKRQKRTA